MVTLYEIEYNYYYNIINKKNSNNRQLKESYIYKYELLVIYLEFMMILNSQILFYY